jgi:hypothetical protein
MATGLAHYRQAELPIRAVTAHDVDEDMDGEP